MKTTTDRDPRRVPLARVRERIPSPPGTDTGTFWLLLTVVVVLNIIGLVMVLSASSVVALNDTGSSWTYFTKQALWMFFGVIAMILMLYVDVSKWRRYARLALLLSLAGLIAVLVPGVGITANGATRWVGFGPIQIQPSEIAKLGVLLFVADLLARRADRITDVRYSVRPVVVVLGMVAFLIMMQPNLGTTIVVATIVFAVLVVAGAPGRSLAAYGTLGAGAAVVLALASAYRRARILSFLHPWADPQHKGYQLIQSQVGLASGGMFGLGLGASRAKWGFLPFAYTDFIFAIIGEELGLVGATLVIALFVALAVLGIRTAMRASDQFGALMATGITTWLVVQAFVNIGAVIGILPITGVPLPFISFGGSSLLLTLAAAGLLLNVARHPAPVAAKAPAAARARTADRRVRSRRLQGTASSTARG
jgi:cell division protein FtsW